MDSKRKGLRVSFPFIQENTFRVKETVVTVGELRDSCEPGAKNRVPPFAMN